MRIKLLPLLLLLLLTSIHAEEKKNLPVCLLTGFDPFGGAKTNPSWDAIKDLQGTERNGFQIECVQLPVVYDAMAKPLEEAITKFKPRVVICFGQGGPEFRVETEARNGYNIGKYPDNIGKKPSREEILPGEIGRISTMLPAEKLIAALKEANLQVLKSEDAGGYLCNECFYRLMSDVRGKIDPDPTPFGKDGHLVRDRALIRRGFVHVPILDSINPLGEKFSLEVIKRGVLIVIEETLKSLPAPHDI